MLEGLPFQDLKIYYKAIVIKNCHKNRYVDEQNKTKDPNTSTYIYILSDIQQHCQKTYIGENTASSINGAGKTRCPHVSN